MKIGLDHRGEERHDHRPDENAEESEGERSPDDADEHDDEGKRRSAIALDDDPLDEVVHIAHHNKEPGDKAERCRGAPSCVELIRAEEADKRRAAGDNREHSGDYP